MANAGAPLDPNTPIGQVRLIVGDDAPDANGNYAYFSDDAITAALALGDDSTTRACAVLIRQLALSYTLSGQSISADDFKINTMSKGKSLLQVADDYDKQADAEDARAAREDADGLVVVQRPASYTPPEDFREMGLWFPIPQFRFGPIEEAL